jgi:hydrogenase maturation protease
MNLQTVQPVVEAVLYEGYILYPYRCTSAKNRQRWTFGGIYPKVWFEATEGGEPWQMQTQCLVQGSADTRLEVRVRFLQPLAREIGELQVPLSEWPQAPQDLPFNPVPSLTLGQRQFHCWQEAVERDLSVVDCRLGDLLGTGRNVPFAFEGRRELEPLSDDGLIRGVLLRNQSAIQGHIDLQLHPVSADVWRLTVRIENHTPMDPASVTDREQASLYSFASTHTLLGVERGAFVSLMDPPEALKDAAAGCDNQGTYPVLVGEPGARNLLLSSPIILYDYPEIAAQSPGEFFDSTEIDEILSLRILAMTDGEKREMAELDPRSAALLARTEALDGDSFMRLHGVMRDPVQSGPRLVYDHNGGAALRVGDRVRLQPRAGGDAMDLMLAGKTAVIEAIERDFEDRVHVAVTLDDDPGREWGLQRMPGHRFFFSPEEVQSLEDVK